MNYIGQSCTSCRKVFNEGDEIVVCPECGSPYHRECYKNEGRCIYTALHESGRGWQPENRNTLDPAAVGRVCPNCGTHNDASASFCSGCGIPLRQPGQDQPAEQAQPNQPGPGAFPPFGMPPFGGQQPGSQNGMPQFVNVRTVAADTDVDGNTVGEYTEYVGSKFYYYIPKFLRFSKSGSKFSFNFAAFFIPQFWFAYRKMPLYSIISIFASMLFSMPSIILYGQEAGYFSFAWTNSQAFQTVDMLFYILSYVFSLACGIFGNWLYYRKARRDVTRIKSEVPDVAAAVQRMKLEGGVSMPYLWMALGISMLASLIASVFLVL